MEKNNVIAIAIVLTFIFLMNFVAIIFAREFELSRQEFLLSCDRPTQECLKLLDKK